MQCKVCAKVSSAYKGAIALTAAGAVTAPQGVRLAHWLPALWLNLTFVAIMLVAEYRMFMSSRSAQTEDEVPLLRTSVCKVSRETGRFAGVLKNIFERGIRSEHCKHGR